MFYNFILYIMQLIFI